MKAGWSFVVTVNRPDGVYLIGAMHHHWCGSGLHGACAGPSSLVMEKAAILWALRWLALRRFPGSVVFRVDNLEAAKTTEGVIDAACPLDFELQALWASRSHLLQS